MGAGPVGLCAVMAAGVLGAGQVVVLDKVAARLKEAEAIGTIGVDPEERSIELPFGEIYLKGVTIAQGVANITNYMDETLALIAAGKLDPSWIISHRSPMSDAAEAYRMFHHRAATKIVLDPWG
ncbi:MAG: hypothetical protein J2P19_09130 [Pseudonocardia sp.]|nr:hypothetical protein [Pseudonocardia sp.]